MKDIKQSSFTKNRSRQIAQTTSAKRQD